MLVRKFIKPNIFCITQTTMSFIDTKIQEVIYARFETKWYRIANDKLETALRVLNGELPMYARELTQGEVIDLKTRHLEKSENREDTLQW